MREATGVDEVVRERFRAVLGRDTMWPADGAALPPVDGRDWAPSAARPAAVPAETATAPPSDPRPAAVLRETAPARPAVAPPAAGDGEPPAAETAALTALGAFDPGRRGVRALAVVAGIVVLIAAVLAWRARPRVDPVPSLPGPAVAAGPNAASTGPPGELVVAVAGKVRRPGLVRLPAGSRVADALQAAGGVTRGTDPSMLNLARKVVDGELLLVGVSPPPGAPPAGQVPAGGAPVGGPVNINTANLAELDTLPGVGPVLAQRILDHRAQHGGFTAVRDLRKVDGIGDSRYEQLKDLVTV